MTSTPKITVGADVEFILEKNGQLKSASDYLCPAWKVGCDGYDVVGEVRPGYSEDPMEVISMIRECLKFVFHYIPSDMSVLAGHCKHGLPIGGHIHFGLGYRPVSNNINGIGLIIDNLAFVCKHLLDKFGPVDEWMRRTTRGYGRVGDWHTQDWGFEYRHPGSWIISPDIALMYLSMAKIAVQMSYMDVRMMDEATRFNGRRVHTIRHLIKEHGIDPQCWTGYMVYEDLVQTQNLVIDWNKDIKEEWI